MAGRFDSYSAQARRVLTCAQEEARAFRHNFLGTEHLLLGLLRVEDGLAATALANLGLGLTPVRLEVQAVVGMGTDIPVAEVGATGRLKKVFELAQREAKHGDQRCVGTPHLLLGVFQEGRGNKKGIAVQILQQHGVTEERFRGELLKLLALGAGEDPSEPDLLPRVAGDERGVRRYSLVFPEELFLEVQQLADRQQTTVVELLRRFTRLGLLASQVQENPNATLIIREGAREREILLL